MANWLPILTALIALVGTLIGLWLANRRWHRDTERDRYGQFEKDRQAAYKELWERVEGINVLTRTEKISESDFSVQVTETNAFMLKKGLYIDDEDRTLVNEYLEAVFHFQQVIRDSENQEAKVRLGLTQTIPPHVIALAKEIGQAQGKATTLRSKLSEKAKHVLAGTA